jgi:DNA/RNA-binding domain of Phe-tRNA-synthetase-like protein
MLTVSDEWQGAFPGAAVGVLAMRGVVNPERHAALEQRKAELEEELRSRFAPGGRAAIKALPVAQAYAAHYARFNKTYHVQLQLESVALKGKSIPRVAALVEAMFMAELQNLLLTAGHDVDAVQAPLRVDMSTGLERYTMLNGQEQTLKPGDMCVSDALGVISDVVYGPDQRTRITSGTRHVLFVVYAPAGIGAEAVRRHLDDIAAYARLIAPQASTASLDVYVAEQRFKGSESRRSVVCRLRSEER